MQTAVWIDQFPGLARLEPAIRAALTDGAQIVKLPGGARIFGPGQSPERFLLLIDGVVRVQQVSEGGREIVLYRITAGESCALTTACLMGYEDYQAEALAETDVTAVAVPRSVFDRLVATSPEFRRFVFTAFSVRVTNLFRIIDEVAFQRIDIRLAHKLLERAGGDGFIETTHQQLAAELGTAREVVSRQLHEFQRRGWIAGARGSIELRDRDALKRLAEG
jgi:CRP/FNR family transcriptional regulator